jgi:hypothetical protein
LWCVPGLFGGVSPVGWSRALRGGRYKGWRWVVLIFGAWGVWLVKSVRIDGRFFPGALGQSRVPGTSGEP